MLGCSTGVLDGKTKDLKMGKIWALKHQALPSMRSLRNSLSAGNSGRRRLTKARYLEFTSEWGRNGRIAICEPLEDVCRVISASIGQPRKPKGCRRE